MAIYKYKVSYRERGTGKTKIQLFTNREDAEHYKRMVKERVEYWSPTKRKIITPKISLKTGHFNPK